MGKVVSLHNRTLREKTFYIIGRPNDLKLNRIFNTGLMILILSNVLAVILETVPSLGEAYGNWFHGFEYLSVAVFSVEYALRVWTSSLDPRFGSGLKGKLRYMKSFFAVVDLLAILPSLLSFFFVIDLRAFRAIRLFRLIRLFKLGRYSLAMFILVSVFRNKKPDLIVTMSLGLVLMIFSASIMYFVEHEAQPEKYSSIPMTMWWAVSTLATIGYGDVYPITPLGKFFGSVVAFLGVGFFALPAAILATGFSEIDMKTVLRKRSLKFEEKCPLCGEKRQHKKSA